jgi:hypothetical protein
MPNRTIPHFVIKNKSQKGGYLFSDILTPEILRDVCERVTGCTEYTYEFVEDGYNKGRLATLEYRGIITYVSFSERGTINGRNYFFQSLTTAVVRSYLERRRICFYFLQFSGNVETRYFMFMYRLAQTAGVEFLNADVLTQRIYPFIAVDDIIAAREKNKNRNRSNNSTYITRSSKGITQIYGKTYGASKKETGLLCIAVSRLAQQVELYEICENDLSELPRPDLEVIQNLDNVKIIPTNLTMEQHEFEEKNSIRSPRFTYNLLEKLGPKKCGLCECEIPELVEGAHIWPVAEIKRAHDLSIDQKIECAIDGDNGIWLCDNHHTMLDENLVNITSTGMIECKQDLEEKSKEYIRNTTPITQFTLVILTNRFVSYLQRRYDMARENSAQLT